MNQASEESKMYVLYNRSTGVILGTYAVFDAETESYRTPTSEEARSAFGNLLEEKTEDQVEMMEVSLPPHDDLSGYYIDMESRQLSPMPHLQIQADRVELEGDGQDSVDLAIRVVDTSGNLLEYFSGDLRVTTTRGRLSIPGGRIKAEHGRASITLTSVAETIARVTVIVQDPSGCCLSGSTHLEFL